MIKAVVFDLDGVLYCGNKAVEGAIATVLALRDLGKQVFYLTNNSGKTRWQIVGKLRRLGFSAELQGTYCASYALAKYLAEQKFSPVYLVGTEGLKNELSECNVRMEDRPEVPAVVVGLDTDYCRKVPIALNAIVKHGAKLVVANLDPWYPAGGGEILPGCGAVVGAIVGATCHKPDFIVGKPNTYMLELFCKEHGLSAKDICVVGDVPESDIKMADKFGCQSILFDPENVFQGFPNKINKLSELLSVLN